MEMHRLLPLLLLLAWPFFYMDRGGSPPPLPAVPDLHPIVLLPGHSCSQIDARLTAEYRPSAAPRCGARKGEGWFRLYKNYTALLDLAEVPCYAEQLRVVYDHAAGDYRDVAGVETRVVSFGTTRGFHSDDPASASTCMARLVEALKPLRYREGENLFGAPYDFRYAPAPPGLSSRVFSGFLSSLTWLVEHASTKNQNKPVILVTHSHGGINGVEFLNRTPPPWRRRYVKHFVMVSTGVGGIVAAIRGLAHGATGGGSSSPSDVLAFGNVSRSFGSAFLALPSPTVFGDAPLVITEGKNYTARDMPEFLRAAGFSDEEVALYRTRALPVTLGFRAPVVPVTCINGVGVPTPEKLVYGGGGFGEPPQVVYGDGDGEINMASILALNTVIGDDPEQRYFKSVLIPKATHVGILEDDFALERVVNEIFQANHAVN